MGVAKNIFLLQRGLDYADDEVDWAESIEEKLSGQNAAFELVLETKLDRTVEAEGGDSTTDISIVIKTRNPSSLPTSVPSSLPSALPTDVLSSQ